jgi:hypothetical protein
MSAFTDEVVRICTEELELFERGKLQEYDKKVYRRVGEYWDALAKIERYKQWKGYNGRSDTKLELDGNGNVLKVVSDDNQPWSAAFISWVVRTAGGGESFQYAPSHSLYIVKALQEAKNSASTAKFIARRHKSYAPRIGDLIACERRKMDDANFDTYIDFVASGRYEAHCDFVIGLNDKKTRAITVGGNVGNSVSQKEWPLDENGRIGDRDPTSKIASVICIIECRL